MQQWRNDEKEEEKEMEAAKEDAPKKLKQKRWLKIPIAEESQRTQHQMLTNYKKSLMLW
jgi:hypothetical protein